MSHLESIYLANVVLFFPSISVAQKFVMINKKCLDVLNIIRIFPVFEEDRWLFDFDQIVRFNKTKLLFPKAQTIHYSFLCCKYKELIPNSIQQYVITPEVQLTSNEFNRIKDIIVEYQTTTNNIVDVTDMKILRKINIECNTNNLEKFFVNKHKRIEYVKIVFTKMIDIKFLKHIKEYNFEKVVIFVCEKEELDKVVQIPNIFLFVTICFGWWYDGIHNNVVIINRYLFQNIEQNNVFMLCTNSTVNSNVVNSYYPYYVRLFHKNQQTWDDLDIGHAIETLYHNESSEEYDYDNSSDSSDDYKCYVRPIKEQNKVIPKVDLSIFTSIEEIEVMNKFECTFPTTITQLQSKKMCNNLYELQNLKEIAFENNRGSFDLPTSLTSLSIERSNIIDNSNHLSLMKLFISSCDSIDNFICTSLIELQLCNVTLSHSLLDLTLLTSLSLQDCVYEYNTKNMFPITLKHLRIDTEQPFKLPSQLNITYLHILQCLNKPFDINLEQYKTLSTLKLSKHVNIKHITFPKQLHTLILSTISNTNINVQNINLKVVQLRICNNIYIDLPKQLNELDFGQCVSIEISKLESLNYLGLNENNNLVIPITNLPTSIQRIYTGNSIELHQQMIHYFPQALVS